MWSVILWFEGIFTSERPICQVFLNIFCYFLKTGALWQSINDRTCWNVQVGHSKHSVRHSKHSVGHSKQRVQIFQTFTYFHPTNGAGKQEFKSCRKRIVDGGLKRFPAIRSSRSSRIPAMKIAEIKRNDLNLLPCGASCRNCQFCFVLFCLHVELNWPHPCLWYAGVYDDWNHFDWQL